MVSSFGRDEEKIGVKMCEFVVLVSHQKHQTAKMVLGIEELIRKVPAVLNPTPIRRPPRPPINRDLRTRWPRKLFHYMEGDKPARERPTDHTQQDGEKSPTPPPHKSFSQANPYVNSETNETAEAYKTAGNRHFVLRNYKEAIDMYSSGIFVSNPDLSSE